VFFRLGDERRKSEKRTLSNYSITLIKLRIRFGNLINLSLSPVAGTVYV